MKNEVGLLFSSRNAVESNSKIAERFRTPNPSRALTTRVWKEIDSVLKPVLYCAVNVENDGKAIDFMSSPVCRDAVVIRILKPSGWLLLDFLICCVIVRYEASGSTVAKQIIKEGGVGAAFILISLNMNCRRRNMNQRGAEFSRHQKA